jgi:cytoskeleton protein RodZ
MPEHPQNSPPPKGTTASFGERLKREREMRGIKLEDIAESTKIGKRNLVALEQEQFDQLPGGIFNKGFVRAYAKYLGLDEEQAVNDFLVASANYDQPAALQPPPTSWVKAPAMPSDDAIRRRNRLRVLLVALLLIGGFLGWFYWKGRLHAAENGNAQEAAQPAPSNAGRSSGSSASPTVPEQPAGNEANPVAAPSAQKNNLATARTPGSSAKSPATAENESKKSVFTVRIQATEDTWVSVTSDGKQVMDVVIPAGEERVIHARQELVLKTGNAGGIEVTHNGVAIGPLGPEKQVKTLTFNGSGLTR